MEFNYQELDTLYKKIISLGETTTLKQKVIKR